MTMKPLPFARLSDINDEKTMTGPTEDQKKFLLSPNWNEGGRVHNWRNHVGANVKAIWHSFTDEQRFALYKDADEEADHEEWD